MLNLCNKSFICIAEECSQNTPLVMVLLFSFSTFVGKRTMATHCLVLDTHFLNLSNMLLCRISIWKGWCWVQSTYHPPNCFTGLVHAFCVIQYTSFQLLVSLLCSEERWCALVFNSHQTPRFDFIPFPVSPIIMRG